MIKMRQMNNSSNWDIVDFVRYHGAYTPAHITLRALIKYENGVAMPENVARVFFRMIDLEGMYYNIGEINSNYFFPPRIRLLK